MPKPSNWDIQKILVEKMWREAERRGILKHFAGWEVVVHWDRGAWNLVAVNKGRGTLAVEQTIWIPVIDDNKFERLSLKMGQEFIKRRMSDAARNLVTKIGKATRMPQLH